MKNTKDTSDDTSKGEFVAFFVGENSFYPTKRTYEDRIMKEIKRKENYQSVKDMFKDEIEEYRGGNYYE